jgi:hypothetical protein
MATTRLIMPLPFRKKPRTLLHTISEPLLGQSDEDDYKATNEPLEMLWKEAWAFLDNSCAYRPPTRRRLRSRLKGNNAYLHATLC